MAIRFNGLLFFQHPFKNISEFKKGLLLSKIRFENLGYKKHLFELKYAKAKLPQIAMILSLLALAMLALFKKFTISLWLSLLTVIIQTLLISSRIYISNRAPVTNMYETVLFSGHGALIIAMIMGHFKNEKIFIFIGLFYNLLCLLMMNFAVEMLSDSISPLVPVLRDNFWLSTHVTCIILSYSALALSWVLANTIMIRKRFGFLNKSEETYYSGLIYTCLKVGTTLLATGVILGGIWADYSWGRFWGWDPKETWSLIVLCLYIGILHGRYTNWIPNSRFVPLTALSFLAVMMAWFGVNYILATGLHSYGFSEGGAIFLISFFSIQIIAIILTWSKQKGV